MPKSERHPASFRDPDGFLFFKDGVLYRQINREYNQEYVHLMASGLYDRLVKSRSLISHREVDENPSWVESDNRIIQPQRVPFISYPYEWCFSQLKDAALLTLMIQKRALAYGMMLKDASAYNIQFLNSKPILIDTSSFGKYHEGMPWDAYRQFCQHFLAPLALMSCRDVRLNQLLRVYIDGVPLDLASELLPASTKFNLGLLTHIHLHASAQRRFADRRVYAAGINMSKSAMIGLVESLEKTIKKLIWKPAGTEWGDYYDNTNYSDHAFEYKQQLVSGWVKEKQPAIIWDLGANTGLFSRTAAAFGAKVISFDIDPLAVERNYQTVKKDKDENILPLLLDLTNPSPSLGWNHEERSSFSGRGPADMVLALALIHHLAISNNLPLDLIAAFFARLCKWLIVEFVPKTDSQVLKLLASRMDIFPNYTRDEFEKAFSDKFTIRMAESITGSERILYLMEHK